MPLSSLAVMGLIGVSACSEIHAASVTGKVEIQEASASELVIFADKCDAKAKPAAPLRIRQKDCGYEPRHGAVVAGQEIEIRNEDSIIHNAFSVAPSKFDVGQQKPSASNTVALSSPGIVKVLCRIHPEMEATLLVLKNPCFARPAGDGTYRIDGLPEGQVELRVWGPRLTEIFSAKAKVSRKRVGAAPKIAIPGTAVKPEGRRSRGCPSETQYSG